MLHTWGSTLTHHPHAHMIVPGGGLSLDGARWVAFRSNFLVHVNVLARLFSGKMLAMLTDAHDAGQLTPTARRPVVGSTIAPRIRISRFDDENGPCSGIEA